MVYREEEMNKEKYEKPIYEIVVLSVEDVITFSVGGSGDEIPFSHDDF